MKISCNIVGDSNDENNFSHNLLLTNTQVSKVRKSFANGSSANIKFSKTQLSKMIKSGEFWPFSLNENPFIEASERVWSLVNSVLKESKNMGAKK